MRRELVRDETGILFGGEPPHEHRAAPVGCGGGSTTIVEPETPDTQKVEVESATSPTDTVEVETSEDTNRAEVEVNAD